MCCRIMRLAIVSIIQNDKGKTRRHLKALCANIEEIKVKECIVYNSLGSK